MQSVLILGSTGMLGSMCLDYLSKQSDISLCASDRKNDYYTPIKYPEVKLKFFEASKIDEKAQLLEDQQYIINCIGITKPDIDEKNPENAIFVNSLFPHKLSKIIHKEARIIQICTDCVYSGEDGDYDENAPYSPTDIYGRTKCLGEVESARVYNLRTSIIGPDGKGKFLFDKVKNAGTERWFGYTNHLWNGITTLAFSKICYGIIKNDLNLIDTFQHIVPTDVVTKNELVKIIAEVYGVEIDLTPKEDFNSIDRTLATNKPTTNEGIWKLAGYDKIPTIEEMIRELKEYEERK